SKEDGRINGVDRLHSGSSIALIRAAKVSARRHSIWNQISMGLSLAWSGSRVVTIAAKFFKSLLRCFVSLGMTRAHGEPGVAELGQNLADRAFMQFDAEAPLQLVAQVHPPPTHHPVTSRIGTRLDQFGQ